MGKRDSSLIFCVSVKGTKRQRQRAEKYSVVLKPYSCQPVGLGKDRFSALNISVCNVLNTCFCIV